MNRRLKDFWVWIKDNPSPAQAVAAIAAVVVAIAAIVVPLIINPPEKPKTTPPPMSDSAILTPDLIKD
ncbi:MAG: hypothetical protein HQL87_16125 [Magnetococcales bacterium]|nr:hypothetical protein [Magnetococcales bacterium]